MQQPDLIPVFVSGAAERARIRLFFWTFKKDNRILRKTAREALPQNNRFTSRFPCSRYGGG